MHRIFFFLWSFTGGQRFGDVIKKIAPDTPVALEVKTLPLRPGLGDGARSFHARAESVAKQTGGFQPGRNLLGQMFLVGLNKEFATGGHDLVELFNEAVVDQPSFGMPFFKPRIWKADEHPSQAGWGKHLVEVTGGIHVDYQGVMQPLLMES